MKYLFLIIILLFALVSVFDLPKKKLVKKEKIIKVLSSSFLCLICYLIICLTTKYPLIFYFINLIIIQLITYNLKIDEFIKNHKLDHSLIPFVFLIIYLLVTIFFDFNYFKGLLILIILTICYALIFLNYAQREIKISLNKKIDYLFLTLLGIFIIYSIINHQKFFLNYPLNYDDFVIEKNPYTLLFEALENGQLSLLIKPSEALINLPNPYGYRGGIDYLWDFAYYKGNYYVYFGIAPVICIYYPLYFLSLGHFIPTYHFLNVFLVIISFYIIIKCLLMVLSYYHKKVNLVLLILVSFTLVISGGTIFLALAEPMYNTPLLFGNVCCYFMIYYAFKGVKENSKLAFALMGLFFILILASRPNLSLVILVLLPLLLPYLFNKSFFKKLINFIPCFIILIIGISLIFTYNYLRFENIFEFGAKYQLTVSDINENTLDFNNLKAALHYYLFQKPYYNDTIPRLILSLDDIINFNLTKWIYTFPTIGLFCFPMSLLIIFGLLNYHHKQIFFTSCFLIIFIVSLSFVNFSLAGVHIRYLMDIYPLTIFLVSFFLISYHKSFIKNKYVSIVFIILIMFLLIYQLYYALNLLVNEWYIEINDYPNLKNLIYLILS